MAEIKDQKIKKPASGKADKMLEGIILHVMPKDFLGRDIAVVKKEVQKVVAPTASLPFPKPVKPVSKPVSIPSKKQVQPPQKKGKKSTLILVSVGIIVITVLAVGAYFMLRETPEPVVIVDNTPPVQNEEPTVKEPVRGQDTDSDGLTDSEEALYGTDFRNPDSDADTFLDGNEVFHSYDPLSFSPITLLDSGSAKRYVFPDTIYAVNYPATWTVTSTMEGVSFKSSRSSKIIVEQFPNPDQLSAEEWYRENLEESGEFMELNSTISKEGFSGVIGDDERAVYLLAEDSVFVFIYDLGEDTLINYLQTFKMIVNSFSVRDVTSST